MKLILSSIVTITAVMTLLVNAAAHFPPLMGVADADGKLMANDLMSYIASRKTVSPKVEGRIELRM